MPPLLTPEVSTTTKTQENALLLPSVAAAAAPVSCVYVTARRDEISIPPLFVDAFCGPTPSYGEVAIVCHASCPFL